jgi:hypothetical protein
VSDEVEIEPIPGLPSELPPGERLLWQGRPEWRGLARHTFSVRWLAAYFGVFIVARGLFAVQDGQSPSGALTTSLMVLPLAILCLGTLTLLAWLNARATVYTITSKRVVMRFGVALPMTFNFPFKRLTTASVQLRPDGEGDIALELVGRDKVAWLHLWPHARPWRLAKAQPMLRSIADAKQVAALLADAVRAWSASEGAPVFAVEPELAQPIAVKSQFGLGARLEPEAGH